MYIVSRKNRRYVEAARKAAEASKRAVEALLLTGEPGAGKTSLAQWFAPEWGATLLQVQCHRDTASDHLIVTPCLEGILRGDAENVAQDGVLVRALKASRSGRVVLLIDELDKAPESVDALLLTFLEECRVSDGMVEEKGIPSNILVFITSNEEREITLSLANRCRRVRIGRLEKADFLKALGLPEGHHVGRIYDACPGFSIRQAKRYLADIGGADELDVEFLSQYCEEVNDPAVADLLGDVQVIKPEPAEEPGKVLQSCLDELWRPNWGQPRSSLALSIYAKGCWALLKALTERAADDPFLKIWLEKGAERVMAYCGKPETFQRLRDWLDESSIYSYTVVYGDDEDEDDDEEELTLVVQPEEVLRFAGQDAGLWQGMTVFGKYYEGIGMLIQISVNDLRKGGVV